MEEPVLQEQMSFLNRSGPRPTSAASPAGRLGAQRRGAACGLRAQRSNLARINRDSGRLTEDR